MSAGLNEAKLRWSPTPTCNSDAKLSLMVSSSTTSRRAALPSTIRGRSTSVPNRRSICAALGRNWLTKGPEREISVSCSSCATAVTSGTRRSSSTCAGVTGPASNSTSADRLACSKRASEVSVRRAPATSASTTAPEKATSNVSTIALRHRRRRSERANIQAAFTTGAPSLAPQHRCGPKARGAQLGPEPIPDRSHVRPLPSGSARLRACGRRPKRLPLPRRSRCGRRACARCDRRRRPRRRRA